MTATPNTSKKQPLSVGAKRARAKKAAAKPAVVGTVSADGEVSLSNQAIARVAEEFVKAEKAEKAKRAAKAPAKVVPLKAVAYGAKSEWHAAREAAAKARAAEGVTIRERRNETRHPDGAAAVAHAGCPQCGARKGDQCFKANGTDRTPYVHGPRFKKWETRKGK